MGVWVNQAFKRARLGLFKHSQSNKVLLNQSNGGFLRNHSGFVPFTTKKEAVIM